MQPSKEEYYNQFLEAPLLEKDRKDLLENKKKYLESNDFNGFPSFGTGGMREVVGLGSNKLNIYNIAKLNMALARVLKEENQNTVVIAYDSRITHSEFSKVSYHCLKEEGIKVKIFKRPTPTPMLSFAVRELKVASGIVLTASHNPPEYNGYKVYWNDGAQIIPPFDSRIEKLFTEISYGEIHKDLPLWIETEINEEDLIEEEITKSYLEFLQKEDFIDKSSTSAENFKKKLKILYSPLHGTGGWIFEKTFQALNYENFSILEEQKEPDGNFPTVKSPNPEEHSAFDRLIAQTKKLSVEERPDILIATDPDADRVGAAIKDDKAEDGYTFINGNQIGSLLLESIAQMKSDKLSSPFICKTIVTTEFQRKIANAYNVKTVETLTGFKYIAEEVGKDPNNYLFGGEESYGYLPISWVRDKDSVSSAVALTELAERKPLIETLDEMFIKYGLYHEELRNLKFPNDPDKKEVVLNKLDDPEAFIKEVTLTRDIADVLDLRTKGKLPKSEYAKELKEKLNAGYVIQYWLEPEGRLTIRPSGTEPKVKVYLSLLSKEKATKENLSQLKKEIQQEAQDILDNFIEMLLK